LKRRAGFLPELVVLAFAVACSSPPIAPSAPGPTPTRPPITVRDLSQRVNSEYVYLTKRRRDNTKAYTLRADANVSESAGQGTGRSDFTNPHITFAGRAGETLVADAPHASIVESQKSIVMTGGVRARTSDGMLLQCDTLTYDEGSDRLHGRGHVLVKTPRGERLSGDRIEANLRLSEMQLSHDRH
jgi:lipopolysaccharide assembly outer membrane protein LptD (OstA)